MSGATVLPGSGGQGITATTSGGTLDNVTVDGDLDLSQQSGVNLTVRNNLVLNGTMSLGNADGSTYGYVYFGDYASPSQTLLGQCHGALWRQRQQPIYNYSNNNGAGATLTIASTVNLHGKSGTLDNAYSEATIVNQGTISADVAGGQLRVGGTGTFTNQGTLSALNGDTLSVRRPWTTRSSTITARPAPR